MRPRMVWIGLGLAGALTLAALLSDAGCANHHRPSQPTPAEKSGKRG